MICIKIPAGGKWHYVRNGRTLCGVEISVTHLTRTAPATAGRKD